MDFGGFNWTLILVGVVALAGVILWAMMRNRSTRPDETETEAATRRVYDEEEREHHGESDNVP